MSDGENYHRIGPHLVRHGDLMTWDVQATVRAGACDFVYSDPPWGGGNLKYWQTMNRKMTGAEPRNVGLEPFLERFFAVIRHATHTRSVVWIEYGVRWRDVLLRHAGAIGLKLLASGQSVYGRPARPLDLFCLAYQPWDVPKGWAAGLAGTSGFATLEAATRGVGLKGKTILDPCCGLGYTARLAVKHGMTFFGNELNGKRLGSTLRILRTDPRAEA